MENVGKIDVSLQKLRAKGIHIAIDDFGTGFSSLTHLKELVIDSLKIDKSFTRDVMTNTRDAALVGAIITMAQSMHLRVIAEGIETERQFEFLRKLNCDVAQGFLLSEPVPGAQAGEFLNDQTNLLPVLDLSQHQADMPVLKKSGKSPRRPAPKVTEVVAGRTAKA
jgi:EAL domain-containing protein (putative c-di-GMP-specific phosphodiesterase class I)